jgi:hypothetical protein
LEAALECGNATHPLFQDLHKGFVQASQCYKYYALHIDSGERRAQLLYEHALGACMDTIDGNDSTVEAEQPSDAAVLSVQTAFIDGNHTFNGGGAFHLEFQYNHDYLAYWEQAERGAGAVDFCAESDRATQCVPSFIYGGRSYDGCTDMSDGYRPWCALAVDDTGHCVGNCAEKGAEWDYCASCSGFHNASAPAAPLSLQLGSGYLSFQFDHRPPLVEEGLPLSYDVKLLGCDVGDMADFTAAYDRFLSFGCWEEESGAVFPCSGQCFSAYCDLAAWFVKGPPANCGWDEVCRQTEHYNTTTTFEDTFCRLLDTNTSSPTALGSYVDQCGVQVLDDKGPPSPPPSTVCPSGLLADRLHEVIISYLHSFSLY